MNLKIYKSGQGYWTRMVSGLGMGLVVVVGVLWLQSELTQVGAVRNSDYALYIQWGIASVIGAAFGLLIFRFVGTRPKSVDFLIATEGEMKKVNWPRRKEIVGSTWIVICGLFLLVAILFLADLAFAELFRALGILDF